MHRTTRRRGDRASLGRTFGLATSAFVVLTMTLIATLALTVVVMSGAVEAGSDEPPPPPVTIAPEFLPESANLSDCVGLVERPGCGSEARGGWRQTAVFAALAVGLGLIFWRVSVGVRRNRAAADPRTALDPDPDTGRTAS